VIFWVAAAALTAVSVAVLLPPLFGRGRQDRGQDRDQALAVYRDQLAQIERDRTGGLLPADEAEALRTEVERRLLAAADAVEPGLRSSSLGNARGFALVLAAGVPALALGLYFMLGSPDLPGAPFAAREAARIAAGADGADADLMRLTEELQHRMAEHPEDPQGWLLLGRSLGSLGRWEESAAAYGEAIRRGAEGADPHAAHGEALALAAGGQVTAEAEAAFRAALTQDPAEPRARYYLGLLRLQQGDSAGALADWRGLVADAPEGASWRPLVEAAIARVQSMTAAAPPASRPASPADDGTARGPDEADIAAASAMSPEEREAFIRGMVDRLRVRLEAEPDDLDGWLRLAHSYRVLSLPEEELKALQHAARLAPDRPELEIQLADAEAALGDRTGAKARLQRLIARLPADAPERALAEGRLQALD
jgi:cytochrome c-type biogenesis protein CcmH